MEDLKRMIDDVKYNNHNAKLQHSKDIEHTKVKTTIALGDLERWKHLNDSLLKLERLAKPVLLRTKDTSTQTNVSTNFDEKNTKELHNDTSFSSSSSSFSSFDDVHLSRNLQNRNNYNLNHSNIEVWKYAWNTSSPPTSFDMLKRNKHMVELVYESCNAHADSPFLDYEPQTDIYKTWAKNRIKA
jgi:hypothetical protein